MVVIQIGKRKEIFKAFNLLFKNWLNLKVRNRSFELKLVEKTLSKQFNVNFIDSTTETSNCICVLF